MTRPDPAVAEQIARYHAAAHAMQSGVAAKMNYDPDETTPKHLRVGVNSAMVETSTIVKLLIAKGIITESEWYAVLADGMEAEKALYEAWLTERMGSQVHLG
ncbi:MAG TPA: hypothetical protein VGX25_04115 [Actinophytocola sp.]|uniref:hypothetical protein n=1 Tax=Actinophytocola sp. TaxID=1872138 RepID=UPI002DDDBAA8|nr:hypothetical protein [Actinophytocola sp.]HEV2778564.1 hypothetical protein [Actinophytocola sp.]